MQPTRDRNPGDGLEPRLGLADWVQAIAALALVLLGAALVLAVMYRLMT